MLSTCCNPILRVRHPGKIPVHGRLKAHFHDNQAVLFSRNLLHPHPDGLSAHPKAGYWYRDSPVTESYFCLLSSLKTRTWLSMCFVVSPHFARAERTSYCVNEGNSCQISSIQVVRLSPLTSCSKISDLQIFSQFTGAGNRRNQPENTFQQCRLSDSVGADQSNFLPSFHRKRQWF